MFRCLLVLVLLLASGEVSGLFAFVEAAVDGDACADDGRDCHCPPGCTCGCCWHAARTLILVPALAAPLSLVAESAAPTVEEAPPPTDPREIFHVPRPSLLRSIAS
jgi:hypothetical protein